MPVARAARGGPSTSVRARASIDETRILRMNVTLRRTWTRNPTAGLRRSAETIRRLFGVGKSPTLASAGPLRNPEVGLHKPETARAFASEHPEDAHRSARGTRVDWRARETPCADPVQSCRT